MPMDLKEGYHIQLTDGRLGTICFLGETHFQTGTWVGVVLEDESGKNDGSVAGQRYFQTTDERGLFVRPSAIADIVQKPQAPELVPQHKPVNGGIRKTSRPSSVAGAAIGRRISVVPDAGAGKRSSMNAASPSPAPGTKGSRPSSLLRSPTKSPTRQPPSAISSNANSRTATQSVTRTPSLSISKPPRPGGRTSMGPPALPASRNRLPSVSSTSSSVRGVTSRTTSGRANLAPQRKPGVSRVTSIGSQLSSAHSDGIGQDTHDHGRLGSPDKSDHSEALSPRSISPTLSKSSATGGARHSPDTARATKSPTSQRSDVANTAASRQIEDLKTKNRLTEKKLMEYREKLNNLDKIQAERDKYEGIIQKLQAKYQPQQQEITELRKQLRESATKFAEIESIQAEHDVVLEMATLDREMAEETAEVLRTELEAFKQKSEELELEVEVLREENAELGSVMSPEEKTSHGWLHMERNNERLRSALVRLRDMTQQTESELRDEIRSLEEDVKDLASVKDQYEIVKVKLAQSEAGIEDLQQQLDGALGAEDMIIELTERNENLSHEMKDLHTTIEDLESLKELNDELEINHIETEKDMQEELDSKDNLIAEYARRAVQQEETIEDMEYTLSRFRELVNNLQSDIEDMKASHAVTETESEQLNSRSRAMLDLNMKLQVSAAKTQVKTIDLELRRLDAQEASEHLAIVRLFLPEAYQLERDSVLALLRFRRISFKARLLQSFVKERVNGQLPSGHEDDIIAACDVLDKLAWVTAMCECFINDINHCSPDQFAKYEGALYELEPVERALNSWIDGLRRDELKEKQCAIELQRTIALLSHLGEIHITPGLASFAENIHMRTILMQANLENAAAAMTAMKNMVQRIIPNHDQEDQLAEHFHLKSDFVITHLRSAKVVVSKAARSVEELKTRSLSLMPNTLEAFEKCGATTHELGDFTRRIGLDLYTLLHEEGRIEPFTYIEVQSTIQNTTQDLCAISDPEIFSSCSNKLHTLGGLLTELSSLTSDLGITQEFERQSAPWILRSQEIRSSKAVPIDAEDQLRRLKDENHERARLIAMRDQTLEESAVKIELLESRMRDATKKNEKIHELERRLEDAKRRESELADAMEIRDREIASAEGDRDKWKTIADEAKSVGITAVGGKVGQERTVATAREMDALRKEVERLQAAVRYLREDNHRIHLNASQDLDWLSAPLVRENSREEQRRELISQEGNELLDELLGLCTNAKARIPDLRFEGDRLSWRPAKETPRYGVAKRREEFESWRDWSEDVVEKGREMLSREKRKRNAVEKRRRNKAEVLARVDFVLPYLPAWGEKIVHNSVEREVQIVDVEEWEGFRQGLGFV